MSPKKMREAFVYGRPLIDRLVDRGARCMEQVIDKQYALFFERWLFPNGRSVVVMYSPTFREVFIQPKQSVTWQETDAALDDAMQVST